MRRLKSELAEEAGPKPDGSPRFPTREIKAIYVDYPDSEADVHNDLETYVRAQQLAAKGDAAANIANEFVTLLLKKRLLSSPAAFASTLEQHISTLTRSSIEPGPPTAKGGFGRRLLGSKMTSPSRTISRMPPQRRCRWPQPTLEGSPAKPKKP